MKTEYAYSFDYLFNFQSNHEKKSIFKLLYTKDTKCIADYNYLDELSALNTQSCIV